MPLNSPAQDDVFIQAPAVADAFAPVAGGAPAADQDSMAGVVSLLDEGQSSFVRQSMDFRSRLQLAVEDLLNDKNAELASMARFRGAFKDKLDQLFFTVQKVTPHLSDSLTQAGDHMQPGTKDTIGEFIAFSKLFGEQMAQLQQDLYGNETAEEKSLRLRAEADAKAAAAAAAAAAADAATSAAAEAAAIAANEAAEKEAAGAAAAKTAAAAAAAALAAAEAQAQAQQAAADELLAQKMAARSTCSLELGVDSKYEKLTTVYSQEEGGITLASSLTSAFDSIWQLVPMQDTVSVSKAKEDTPMATTNQDSKTCNLADFQRVMDRDIDINQVYWWESKGPQYQPRKPKYSCVVDHLEDLGSVPDADNPEVAYSITVYYPNALQDGAAGPKFMLEPLEKPNMELLILTGAPAPYTDLSFEIKCSKWDPNSYSASFVDGTYNLSFSFATELEV